MAKPIKEKKERGRPLKIDDEVLAKLEHAFKIGANDVEACEHANIDPATLYRYQDRNPEFCKQKEAWKRNPIFKAKYTIYKNLEDPNVAKWLLERKCKEEFSIKVEQEVTHNAGEDVRERYLKSLENMYADKVGEQQIQSESKEVPEQKA